MQYTIIYIILLLKKGTLMNFDNMKKIELNLFEYQKES